MSLFEGAGVAMITPINKKGGINYDKLEELIERQIENHTDALFICCTTGEAATMTEEEHIGTIRFAVNRVKGRIPVIAGTGSNNKQNVVLAAIDGLSNLKTPEEVAKARGISVEELLG